MTEEQRRRLVDAWHRDGSYAERLQQALMEARRRRQAATARLLKPSG